MKTVTIREEKIANLTFIRLTILLIFGCVSSVKSTGKV